MTVTSARPLAVARTAALTADKARDALGALGGTPYWLGELEFAVADGLFLAVGDLKDLRRRAVAALDERRLAARRRDARRSARGSSHGVPRAASPAASRPAPTPRRPRAHAPPGEQPLVAPVVDAFCLDLRTADPPAAIAAAADGPAPPGLPLRARLPEILFDDGCSWLRACWRCPGTPCMRDISAARGRGRRRARRASALMLEYPLQGLNGLAAGVAAGLAGRPPAAVVASPEASLDEIAGLAAAMAAGCPARTRRRPSRSLAFGRQQVLHTRDQLGRAEGLFGAPGPAAHVGLAARRRQRL